MMLLFSMSYSTFYVMLSGWLSLSLQFTSLWEQTRLPSSAGSARQSDEYKHMDTSALFSCFVPAPALKLLFKLLFYAAFYLIESFTFCSGDAFSHSRAAQSQQSAEYLSVPLVKYLCCLWYF